MASTFMWTLAKGIRSHVFVLHGLILISIVQRPDGSKDIAVDLHKGPTIARSHALDLTEKVERETGMELYRVYGCGESEDLKFWATKARDHYRDGEPIALLAVTNAVTVHIVRNGEVLFA